MADLLKQWGFSDGFHVMGQSDVAAAVAIGAPWYRADVDWRSAEPTQGQAYNWTRGDSIVNPTIAAGGKPLLILDYAPAWAAPAGSSGNLNVAPAFYSNFANYCKAAVTRYAPLGVTHYEIWNEQNKSGNWGGHPPDPAAYVAMLKVVYPAMKAAAAALGRSIIVMSGGPAPFAGYTDANAQVGNANVNPVVYIEKMYQNGLATCCDAVAVHMYEQNLADPTATYNYQNMFSQIELTPVNVRGLMSQFGDSAKLLHATEWGVQSVLQNQANWLVATANWWAAKTYAGIAIWFNYREGDDGGDATYQSFGLRTSANVAKAAWTSYQGRIAALGTGGSSGGGGGGSTGQTFEQVLAGLAPDSWWKLDEATGTFADQVGSKTLTLTGAATARAITGLTGDPADLAVQLGGAGELNAGDNYRFAGTAPFSLVALIDPTTLTSGQFNGIFTKWAAGDGYQLWLNNTGTSYRAGFERDAAATANQVVSLTTATIAPGATILVTATFDGSTMKVYINNEVASLAGTNVIVGSAVALILGGGGNTTDLSAVFSAAAVFATRALNATEVAALVAAIPNEPAGGGGGGGGNAAAYVRELGSGQITATGTTTLALTLTKGATPGDFVVLYLGGKWVTASAIAVTDARGNTWSIDKSILSDGNNNSALLASTPMDVGALQIGDVVTVTVTGGAFANTFGHDWWIEEFAGVMAAPLDKTASGTTALGTSQATGTTAATAQADEIAVAGIIIGTAETSLSASTYSLFATGPRFGGSRSALAAYKILAATGAQSETFTWTLTADSATAIIATYKANPPPPPAGAAARSLLGVGG